MTTRGPTGDIGIFWVYRGRLMPLRTALGEGERRGTKIDSPLAHVEEWPRVVRQYKAEFPMLAILEYDEVPRGRVIFDQQGSCFIVYMDEVLFKDADPKKGVRREVRDALGSAFTLRNRQMVFRTDPHYRTRFFDQTPQGDDDLESL